MSQFCYLTHWTKGKSPPETNQPSPKSKAVRKFICFLTIPAEQALLSSVPRSIQNVSTINQNRG